MNLILERVNAVCQHVRESNTQGITFKKLIGSTRAEFKKRDYQALTADLSEYDREELEYEAHEKALADAEAVENDVDLNSQQVDHQRQESLRRRRQLCQRRLNRREELESQQNGFGKRKWVLKRLQMDLAKLKKV